MLCFVYFRWYVAFIHYIPTLVLRTVLELSKVISQSNLMYAVMAELLLSKECFRPAMSSPSYPQGTGCGFHESWKQYVALARAGRREHGQVQENKRRGDDYLFYECSDVECLRKETGERMCLHTDLKTHDAHTQTLWWGFVTAYMPFFIFIWSFLSVFVAESRSPHSKIRDIFVGSNSESNWLYVQTFSIVNMRIIDIDVGS